MPERWDVVVVGPAPGLEGLWLATGHDSVGVLHSTMTGKLLAPFDPARPSLAARQSVQEEPR